MHSLLKTEPVRVINWSLAILGAIVAVVTNLASQVPDGANWVTTGLIALQILAGELARRFVFSSTTFQSVTGAPTTVTGAGVDSPVIPNGD